MKVGKSTLFFLVGLIFLIYQFISKVEWRNNVTNIEYIWLSLTNILVLVLILLTTMMFNNIKSKPIKEDRDLDTTMIYIEKVYYKLEQVLRAAATIAFTTFLLGVSLLLETEPMVSLISFILLLIILYYISKSYSLTEKVRPGFKIPDPKSKTYHEDLFNCNDDGEKAQMLKTLYNLNFYTQVALVTLMLILLIYSVVLKESQTFPVIGIGLILLFMQIAYTKGMKVED
ncbi:DUF3169 family protein [Solibacillus cecembensis]|uniref:DUF3169 family protein n=1 Tax=Solibacillus cecembensis TaxID=459347 RepID=UPI0007174C5E